MVGWWSTFAAMRLIINMGEINQQIKMDLQGKVNKTYYHMPRALKEGADYLRDRMRFLAPSSTRNSIVNLGIKQQNITSWDVNVGIRPVPWKDRPTPMNLSWRLPNYWKTIFYDQGTGGNRDEMVGGKSYPRLGKGQNTWSFLSVSTKKWVRNFKGESPHRFRARAFQMSAYFIKDKIAEWLKVAWQ
jgi:hypothetical protein